MICLKNALFALSLCSLLTSCATLVNRRSQEITINTTEPSKIILNKDTTWTVKNRAKLSLIRGRDPVEIIAITDSLTKKLKIKSRTSFEYYVNGFMLYPGLIIDLLTPKRFAYPSSIYLNSADTIGKFKRYKSPEKGDLYFNVSLAPANAFKLKPDYEGWKRNTGILGFSAGLDYYYGATQFFNVSGRMAFDVVYPVHDSRLYRGEGEEMISILLSATNNHMIGRFSLGYGLSYGMNSWEFFDSNRFEGPLNTRSPIKRTNISLGFAFSAYYLIINDFNIGMFYQPTFLRFNAINKFQYEHIISFDLLFKLRMGNYP